MAASLIHTTKMAVRLSLTQAPTILVSCSLLLSSRITPLQTKQHLQLHLRNVTTDHHHQIRLPSRNLTRPHRLSFVARI